MLGNFLSVFLNIFINIVETVAGWIFKGHTGDAQEGIFGS